MQKLRALATAALAVLALFYWADWMHALVAGWWLSALKDTAAFFAAAVGSNAVFAVWRTEHLRPREEVKTVQPLTMADSEDDWDMYIERSLTHDDPSRQEQSAESEQPTG